MKHISKEDLAELRKTYTPGTRVRLLKMDDPQAPFIGTLGTVKGIDDLGSIMVVWDTGSRLSIAYGEDKCEIIYPSLETLLELLKEKGFTHQEFPDGWFWYIKPDVQGEQARKIANCLGFDNIDIEDLGDNDIIVQYNEQKMVWDYVFGCDFGPLEPEEAYLLLKSI